MPTRSSGLESILKRSPGLLILPIALVWGTIGPTPAAEPALVLEHEPVAETATSPPTAEEEAGAAPAASAQPLEELQNRIQGMEGKLRESALARKSADQARMEAERRLAEVMQTLEALRTTQAELEQRLSDCESARSRLAETLQRQGTANTTLYRVRPSDNLASISLRFYGRVDQWRAIFEANRHLLDDPDRLTPGMTLVIP